jgi:hypothetical protein
VCLERLNSPQARTRGVEKACDPPCGALVFEQREEINRARVSFKQGGKQWTCPGDIFRCDACIRWRRRVRTFEDLAQLCEGVEEFEPRIRLMRTEARDIASPVAECGDV